MKRILIGFEESQAVMKEFLFLGHDVYSNDIIDTSGPFRDRHLKMDFFKALGTAIWDIIVLHPPCTYTAVCGNRWYYNSPLRVEGANLTKRAWEASCAVCDCVVLEQPKTIMQKYIGPVTQKIQPWQFGHGEQKETWLWIKGLPCLVPSNIVEGRGQRIYNMAPSPDRGRLRSKTYPGIAKAMADQWG